MIHLPLKLELLGAAVILAMEKSEIELVSVALVAAGDFIHQASNTPSAPVTSAGLPEHHLESLRQLLRTERPLR